MSNSISRDSVIVVTDQHVASDFLDDEVVLLDVHKGTYYGFDPIGAQVWKLIQVPTSVADVVRALLDEYDVDEQQCFDDISELLEKMRKHDLIEIRDETP